MQRVSLAIDEQRKSLLFATVRGKLARGRAAVSKNSIALGAGATRLQITGGISLA